MKNYNIVIYDNKFNTIANLKSQNMLNKYIKQNPNTNADNIEINEIGFLGFDEIDLFFNCKNLNEFFKYIN